MADVLRLMVVAGEASGDKHAALLVDALRERVSVEAFGAGGDELAARGVDVLVHARDVAIIGVPEVIRGLGRLYSAYRRLAAAAATRRPDVVVLVDWPDFNLRLANRLRRLGCRVVYYVSPQVWAWRESRVRQIRRSVERMLVIFPFEVDFYRKHGIEVEFVGHPLAGEVAARQPRGAFFAAAGLDPGRPLLAMLPGSRRKEVAYILPPLVDAARLLAKRRPDLQFVLPLAPTVERRQVEELLGGFGAMTIVEGNTYSAVGHADVAVVASGTATVETAILGTPLVVVYRASSLNYRLLRPLIRLDTFGMPNLIAGRRIAPELIQDDCNGERIAAEVEALMGSPERLAAARRDLRAVADTLRAGEGAAPRAAAAVLRVAAHSTTEG
jgi:lipid-A-disaccharide synthase